jgi:positive regulator of sigma E activity
MPGTFETCCGTVESVRENRALVVLSGGRADDVCASCGACGGGRLPPTRVWAATGANDVVPGARVTVRRQVHNPALVAGVVFGLPLVGMCAGMAAAIALGRVSTESPVVVAASVAGLLCGGVLAWLLDRVAFRTHPPQVLATLRL